MKISIKAGVFILIFVTSSFISISSKAQSLKSDSSHQRNNLAIGFKLQNSGQLSIKKYFGDMAFELVAGRPGYYHNRYNRKHPDQDLNNPAYFYTEHNKDYKPWSIQLNMIRHKNSNLINGLTWYYGMGGQIISASYTNIYWYKDQNGQPQYLSKRFNELGIGANAGIGVEYTFSSIPFSIFMDEFMYIEAFSHPLYMKNQFGLGLRYNFR